MKTLTLQLILVVVLFMNIALGIYVIYSVDYEKGEGNVFVIRIIDGDTFKMSDGSIVRILCVNTPEVGEEDYERAKKFLESIILYKKIRLEKSKSLGEQDKYHRELRFVYVQTNNREVFVNKEIISLGFGEFYDYQDKEKECEKTLGL